MGMGSGGMVIIEMQRQMNSARGGQDMWGGLAFALGLYGLFGTFLPLLGSLVLALAVAIRVRQDHLVFTMIDALDPQVQTSFPWRLWATLFAGLIVTVQLVSISIFESLLASVLPAASAMGSGASSAALILALLPVGAVFFLVEWYFDPVRLGLITEWFLGNRATP